MSIKALALFSCFFLLAFCCKSQTDSLWNISKTLPDNYISQVNRKIDTYANRISSKTEKTLTKLSRWENKIKKILEQSSPETAAKLFAPGQPTFASLLQQIKEGKSLVTNSTRIYDEYRDKLGTQLKYLEEQKNRFDSGTGKHIQQANTKMKTLDEQISNSEAFAKFVKERKKQLVDESIKYLGKSKYLRKINKESYYYVETLKNYKEIFKDQKKAEQTAIQVLDKIPAFKKFARENSMLASLFRSPGESGTVPTLAGLQTRASVNAMIDERIATGGPNARELVSQNMQQAQAELSKIKEKVLKAGGNNSSDELPDFKPNMQKTKTFFQRLEYGTNFQFRKAEGSIPAIADIGLSIGYKINDKSLLGLGATYKLGLGKIERMAFSHQGIGLRSFMDWKLKKHFFVSGGFEMNHFLAFKNISQLSNYRNWQQAGLIGITKKLPIKTKLTKGTKLQLLYDVLHKQYVPVSQPFIFRIGYNIK